MRLEPGTSRSSTRRANLCAIKSRSIDINRWTRLGSWVMLLRFIMHISGIYHTSAHSTETYFGWTNRNRWLLIDMHMSSKLCETDPRFITGRRACLDIHRTVMSVRIRALIRCLHRHVDPFSSTPKQFPGNSPKNNWPSFQTYTFSDFYPNYCLGIIVLYRG